MGKNVLERYDSVDEFLAVACSNDKESRRLGSHWDNQTIGNNGNWYGLSEKLGADASCVDVARALAINGDPDGLERLTENMDRLGQMDRPRSIRRRRARGDQGDELDIQRVYSGRLDDAWSRREPRLSFAPRRVTITVTAACAGMHNSDTLFWRGAAAVRLADLATEAGYNVEILMFVGGKRGTAGFDRVSCYVTAKAFGAPLDMALLSGCVCHPAFFRSIGHRWGSIKAKDVGGNGWYTPFDPRDDERSEGDILVSNNVRTLEDARQFVEEQVSILNASSSAVAA